jgi:hypothetical protein
LQDDVGSGRHKSFLQSHVRYKRMTVSGSLGRVASSAMEIAMLCSRNPQHYCCQYVVAYHQTERQRTQPCGDMNKDNRKATMVTLCSVKLQPTRPLWKLVFDVADPINLSSMKRASHRGQQRSANRRRRISLSQSSKQVFEKRERLTSRFCLLSAR